MRAICSLAAAIALSAAALSAGAANAKAVTVEDVAQFKVGVATSADIIAKLGPPAVLSTSSDGSTVVSYGTTHTSPNAASFVPIVGIFAAGAKTSTTTVVFVFGPDGLLKSASTNSTNANCSVGLLGSKCGQ
jgi:hypothetical protein